MSKSNQNNSQPHSNIPILRSPPGPDSANAFQFQPLPPIPRNGNRRSPNFHPSPSNNGFSSFNRPVHSHPSSNTYEDIVSTKPTPAHTAFRAPGVHVENYGPSSLYFLYGPGTYNINVNNRANWGRGGMACANYTAEGRAREQFCQFGMQGKGANGCRPNHRCPICIMEDGASISRAFTRGCEAVPFPRHN